MVTTLWGYFDESGQFKDHRLGSFSLGGAIATVEQWEALETAWKPILAAAGIGWFHMTEMERGEGQFAGWFGDKDRLFGELLSVMSAHVETYIGAAGTIPPHEVDRIRAETSHLKRSGLAKSVVPWQAFLYQDQFAACMRGAVMKGRMIDPEARTSMVFAVYPGIKVQWLAAYFDQVKEQYGSAIGEFATGSPRAMPQLQVADIVSYVLAALVAWPDRLTPRVKLARAAFDKKQPTFLNAGAMNLHLIPKDRQP